MSADRTALVMLVSGALGALPALASASLGLAGCTHPAAVPLAPLPRAGYAHYLSGRLSAYEGDWDAAADALARAAAAAPDQPMVAVELARAQMKARRTAAAVATLARARLSWPDHPQVWLASGDLLAAGDPAEASRAYLRAIQLSPDDERAYLGLAKLQSPDAAEATLRILIAHVPASIEGHYRLAVRLAVRGELAAASRELRAVLERDPDHIDARLDLARALRRQGHLDQAIVETRSAFDRSGQALDIAEELFDLLCEADDRAAAIDLLTLLDDDHSDVEALAVIARLERGMGRIAEARAIAGRISAIDRDAGAIALAEIQIATGERAAVEATLAVVEADGKRAAEARRLTALAALDAGDPARALAVLTARGAPDALDSALVAAFALADLGRQREARAMLAPFGGTRDDRDLALLARARLADRAGDAGGALAILEPLIRNRPDLVPALNLTGFLLADAGRRLTDAERYLRHARELAPGDPAVLDSWGWLLLRRGDARGAVRALDRAARFAPLEPEILVHLAAAWAADGAPRTAVRTLDRAAGLAPTRAVQRRIAAMRKTLPAGDTMPR
ncbi:MAG TPA: tetratricopeptide repeat protein [Kofleriaceae bacterium]